MIVELFDIDDTARMREALALRTRVFVEEQGVPPEEEVDEHDRDDRAAVHALALDAEQIAGAARYYVLDAATIRIGRMAVRSDRRGSGTGRALLAALLAEARRRGFSRAQLHAQTHACGFYAKAGFRSDGEPLWDAGILHQPMTLELA